MSYMDRVIVCKLFVVKGKGDKIGLFCTYEKVQGFSKMTVGLI